jgi:hypothetical protein
MILTYNITLGRWDTSLESWNVSQHSCVVNGTDLYLYGYDYKETTQVIRSGSLIHYEAATNRTTRLPVPTGITSSQCLSLGDTIYYGNTGRRCESLVLMYNTRAKKWYRSASPVIKGNDDNWWSTSQACLASWYPSTINHDHVILKSSSSSSPSGSSSKTSASIFCVNENDGRYRGGLIVRAQVTSPFLFHVYDPIADLVVPLRWSPLLSNTESGAGRVQMAIVGNICIICHRNNNCTTVSARRLIWPLPKNSGTWNSFPSLPLSCAFDRLIGATRVL